MPTSVLQRLQHIVAALDDIDLMLAGKTIDALNDRITMAAYERFLEIVSEASRYLPDDLKSRCGPNIPWRQVADMGNVLRHAYQQSDRQILWNIHLNDLPEIRSVVSLMISDATAANQTPGSTRT